MFMIMGYVIYCCIFIIVANVSINIKDAVDLLQVLHNSMPDGLVSAICIR